MISFDQVLLLQEKVESAVQKIVELKSENDALRSKCSELTNALSEKTELLNSLQADEQKIESSILGALNRLNTIENSIINQSNNSSVLPSQDKADENIQPTSPSFSTEASQNQEQVELSEEDQSIEQADQENLTQFPNQDSLFDSENSIIEPEFDDDDSTDNKKYDIF